MRPASVSHYRYVPLPLQPIVSYFCCLHVTFLEKFTNRHQLLDYLYHILVELSSSAVGFHVLMDSKMSTTSWWTALNGHKYIGFISIWSMIGPICKGSALRPSMQSTSPTFFLRVFLCVFSKCFLGFFLSDSRTSISDNILVRFFLLINYP